MRRIYFLLFLFLLPSSLCAQATVSGRVIFEGMPPPAEKVEVKSDISTCGSSKEIRKIMLGNDRGVANAVVRIIGAAGTPELKKGRLDQVSCEFVPHVQVVPVGSVLTLTSSDPVLHNSHAFYEDGSTAFNIAVPIAGMEMSHKLDRAGVLKLRCDAGHTWMSAYIVVTEEPFYALTDANGNFKIDGVPPGNYEIEAWHEWLGKTRQPITVTGEKAEPVTLIFKEPSKP